MRIFSEDVKKILMAGVGAISAAAEKTADFVEDMVDKVDEEKLRGVIDSLAKKGEDVFRQGKACADDLKKKVSEALKPDSAADIVDELTDEELDELLTKARQVKEERMRQGEEKKDKV